MIMNVEYKIHERVERHIEIIIGREHLEAIIDMMEDEKKRATYQALYKAGVPIKLTVRD